MAAETAQGLGHANRNPANVSSLLEPSCVDELITAVICASMLGSAWIGERRSTMPPSGKCEWNGESKKESNVRPIWYCFGWVENCGAHHVPCVCFVREIAYRGIHARSLLLFFFAICAMCMITT
jgi:hypothetical protein